MNRGGIIWVLDASALIDTKRDIVARHQWSFLERLKTMVEHGCVCFPKAVRNELQQARHVDTPEAWALDVGRLVRYSYEPANETVTHVMGIAGDIVDADAEGDPADPYVLAQAIEIQSTGVAVCVVTHDRLDHLPIKIAMTTACARLGLPDCGLEAFLASIGFDPASGWTTE